MLLQKSFYFVRHGQTDHNAQEICAGGTTDVSLNQNGCAQAEALYSLLQEKKFGAVFASPLKRAVTTAFLATGQHPQISHDLREWELGDFEGAPVKSFLAHLPTLPFQEALPKGESREYFFKRSLDAVNEVLKNYETPLIVAHGGTYWAILHTLQLPTELLDNGRCIYFEWGKTLKRHIL